MVNFSFLYSLAASRENVIFLQQNAKIYVLDGINLNVLKVFQEENRIICAHYDSGLFAIAREDKTVVCFKLVFEKQEEKMFLSICEQITSFKVPKPVTAFLFKPNVILFSDRFGDVHSHSIEKGETKLLLGQISLITDMIWCEDKNSILTADRDERIRCSYYPKTHVIEHFYMNHTEYVSRLSQIPWSPSHFISGGGDDFVCIWNTQDKLAKTIQLRTNVSLPESINVSSFSFVEETETILVAIEDCSSLVTLNNDVVGSITFDSNVGSVCVVGSKIFVALENNEIILIDGDKKIVQEFPIESAEWEPFRFSSYRKNRHPYSDEEEEEDEVKKKKK